MNDTLSLCMMVRNGAGTIFQALLSARPYVDEICVLDTGSTDGTQDIVREWADRLVEEVREPFHFAEARNASVEMARCRYVLILDADEYLEASADWSRMRELLDEENPTSVRVNLHNRLAEGAITERIRQRRIFRAGVRWEGAVHHYLADDDQTYIYESQAVVHHTGFDLEPMERRAKYLPRVELNRQACRESRDNPKRYAYYRFKLAEALMMVGEHVEAAQVFRWCFKNEHLRHVQFSVGSYWVKCLVALHTRGRKIDKDVAAGLAATIGSAAARHGEPVPLFFSAWLLMAAEQEIAGLKMMAVAHEMAYKGPSGPPMTANGQPRPSRVIEEHRIRRCLADFIRMAGMPATANIIQTAPVEEAAPIIQEFADAFEYNPNRIADRIRADESSPKIEEAA